MLIQQFSMWWSLHGELVLKSMTDNSCTIGHESVVVPLNFKKTRKTGKWENYDTLSKSGNSPDPWYPILQNAKTSFNMKTRRNSFFVLIYL